MLADYTLTTDALSEGEWEDVRTLINYYEVIGLLPTTPFLSPSPLPRGAHLVSLDALSAPCANGYFL